MLLLASKFIQVPEAEVSKCPYLNFYLGVCVWCSSLPIEFKYDSGIGFILLSRLLSLGHCFQETICATPEDEVL